MKKIGLFLSVVGTIVIALTGCGDNKVPAEPKKAVTNVNAAASAPVTAPAPAPAAAIQNAVKLEGQPEGCKIRMEGTSTIHDWHAESMIISGSLDIDPSFPLDPAVKPKAGKINAKASVTIPVRSLKSSSGKPMDIIMYDYMKIKDFPKIEFHLNELELRDQATVTSLVMDVKGELTVSGKTNALAMIVKVDRIDKQTVKFTTGVPIKLKMTDFGIQPPNPNIGGIGIKTGDEVIVTFEWTLALPAKQ